MNLAIIPARYASTRFPGKVLEDLHGKTILQHVFERVSRAEHIDRAVIATDDGRIAAAAADFGAVCVMTHKEHKSGTDRCFEAIKFFPAAGIVVNVQGDEPFIHPAQVDQLVSAMQQDDQAGIATLVKADDQWEAFRSAHIVKCVFDDTGHALYFSRSAIPFQERGADLKFFKHIGIYAFRGTICNTLAGLSPSYLEKTERLEQLRWMENGYRIKVIETVHDTIGIDTPEDLQRARKMFPQGSDID